MTYQRATAVGLALGSVFADAFVAPGPATCPMEPISSTGSTAHLCRVQPRRSVVPDSTDPASVSTTTSERFNLGDLLWGGKDEDATCLPQDPQANNEVREEELAQKRDLYRWSFDGNLGVPYLEDFPPDDESVSFAWIFKTASAFVRTFAGTTRGTIGIGEVIEALSSPTEFKAFLARISELLWNTDNDVRPTELDDYNDLHAFPMKTPPSVHDWDDDEAYARRRLQGVNSITIEKCTEEHRAKLKILEDPSYAELREKVDDLLAAGKLFVVDHGMINGVEADPLNDSIERHLTPGIALFERVDDEVLPIRALGIQLNQGDGETALPIFTPDDPEYTWNIAKACFEASDQLCHETVSHLGYTHLVLEGPLVAMNRCLPSSHPLNKLLRPHLEGTALINWAAQDSLMAEDGPVERAYAPKIEDAWTLVSAKVLERIKGDFSPPAEIAARGVSADDLPGQYMYRDIGLKYWDAIYTWVHEYLSGLAKVDLNQGLATSDGRNASTSYCLHATLSISPIPNVMCQLYKSIRIYYTSEADIEGDYELQAFVDEMVTKGSFTWLEEFGKTSNKLDLLTKVFATLIHTASVLHAAVNFPQATFTSYVPSSPSAVYAAPPESKAEKTYEEFLAYLPPMEISTTQVSMLTLLGSVFYTELGDYEWRHFSDNRVSEPLERFQDKIEDIGSELSKLNSELISTWKARGKSAKVAKNFAYSTLLPNKIPQSINI